MALQHAIFILTLGYIFASIQKENYASFFVYFATGYTFWILISSFVTSAGNTFMGINGLPNMTNAALSNHIYLQFTSQILLFAHKIIPLVVILLIFHNTITINFPLLLCGFLMLMIFGFWMSALLGCLSLRFQDIKPAFTSNWRFPSSPTKTLILGTIMLWWDTSFSNFNPFYHILVVVRGNIINEDVTLFNWIAVLIINMIGIGITLWVLRWARPKLAYWVG